MSFVANVFEIHVLAGRPGLWEGLEYGAGVTAVKYGLSASSNFKTYRTYVIQAMSFDKGTKQILQEYIQYFRPQAAQHVDPLDTDPLILGWDGDGVRNWSSVLSLLWKLFFNKEITTTIFRYYKATMVALRCQTEKERKVICEADCHTLLVNDVWYKKIFQLMDSRKALNSTKTAMNLPKSILPFINDPAGKDESAIEELRRLSNYAARGYRSWSDKDTTLIMDNYHIVEHRVRDKWKTLLALIQPKMDDPYREPGHLKDKWRTELAKRNRAEARRRAASMRDQYASVQRYDHARNRHTHLSA